MVHVPHPEAILRHRSVDSLLTRGKSREADLSPSIQLLGFKTTHHFLRSLFQVADSILYATNDLCVYVYTYVWIY